MPLVIPEDDAIVQPKPSPVVIAKPQYKGITVDTKKVPIESLLSHVEGSSWTVNYYSQVLDLDSGTAGQGLGVNAVHQQYNLIKGLELKVTSPLVTTQDSETKSLTVSGSAIIYPFVIPNEGDMFLADIGDGKEAVIQINNVVRLSVFQQTCHSIDYVVVDYSTDERRRDFDDKTVRTYYYERDFLLHGQNPLLFEEDYNIVQYLRKKYRFVADNYFKTFFSREYSTLLVPLQLTPTYDHFLTKSVLNAFTTWDSQEVRYIKRLNVQDDLTLNATSIWDVIFNKDPSLLNSCFTQVGKVYSHEFSPEPMYEGIRFSGIKEVIYPVDPLVTVDYSYTKPNKLVSASELTVPATSMKSIGSYLAQLREKTLDDYIDDELNGFYSEMEVDLGRHGPLINPSMKNNYYVLSEDFYKNNQESGKQSKLEICIRQYLNDQAINYNTVKQLCDEIPAWNPLDQFYYTPIVLVLMNSIIKST